MATTASPIMKPIAGGSFLIEDRTPEEIFTPEDFSEEQRQILETASQFAMNEILPMADRLEAKDFEVTRSLLRKAGDLGLMAIDIPEEYGGLAMDKTTSAIVADRLSVTRASPSRSARTSGSARCPSSGTARRSRRRNTCPGSLPVSGSAPTLSPRRLPARTQ